MNDATTVEVTIDKEIKKEKNEGGCVVVGRSLQVGGCSVPMGPLSVHAPALELVAGALYLPLPLARLVAASDNAVRHGGPSLAIASPVRPLALFAVRHHDDIHRKCSAFVDR